VTQNRVLSMALIHNHLHRSSNPEAVDMADYIRSLCEQLYDLLATTPETLQLHLDLAPLQLATEQAVPCGMLANELVSNAFKHAFPKGCGELRVTLQPAADGRMVRLCVADNGVGLPPGFSLEDDASMGLQVASGLTHQLGGTLEIGTGVGTRFEIFFPIRHP
jgi:two-component sensor histidine kinase